MVERVEAVVIGAGAVGIAIARSLALAGKPPLIVEGEKHFGSSTSSRNSEVIHAGIYYPPSSLKSRFCVEGKAKLYAFCRARGIPHKRIGKIIFTDKKSQINQLETIMHRAFAAGVEDLVMLDRGEAARMESELACVAAVHSPSTGIIDSHAFMLALLGEAEANDAMLATSSYIERATRKDGLWQIWLKGMDEPVVETPILVNSAGLNAQQVALAIEGLDQAYIPPLYLARGAYFTYSGRVPFSHLIYPVPEPGGLGTHLTIDLSGQARFGPDVEWIDVVDYTVDPARHGKFAAAARKIWPTLDPERLQPGYAGIRPKLSGPGGQSEDFMILGPEQHGCEGLVNLFGIESPGLTASIAIADCVMEMLA